MNVTDYSERVTEIGGWPVRITTYRRGETYYCKTDNVSPGAALARTSAPSRDEAEKAALEKTTRMLARTKRHPA
jgi:hypothetical protein